MPTYSFLFMIILRAVAAPAETMELTAVRDGPEESKRDAPFGLIPLSRAFPTCLGWVHARRGRLYGATAAVRSWGCEGKLRAGLPRKANEQ